MGGNTTGFYEAYARLLRQLLDSDIEEVNERTGHGIKMLRGARDFSIEVGCDRLPVPGVRRVFPASAAVEVAWQVLGTKDPDFIQRRAPLWAKFIEADGTIPAAYGYRWRRHFGRDQLSLAAESLSRNPSDRQVVVCAWDPGDDALGAPPKKNVPCPVLFHLSSTPDRRLLYTREVNMAVLIRSSDVFVGLVYDVMGYALLLKVLVAELRKREIAAGRDTATGYLSWRPGLLHFTLCHPHLYDSHYQMASDALSSPHVLDEPKMPSLDWCLRAIEADPDGYIAEMRGLSADCAQPGFNPRPEVIE
jgi:thymidylate synthase